MALAQDFHRLAKAYTEGKQRAEERRRARGALWEETKKFLGDLCSEIQAASKDYPQFGVNFSCVNGTCSLLMSRKPAPDVSCEQKFRYDVQGGKVVVTDNIGSVEHAYDLDSFGDDFKSSLLERIEMFQEAFFRKLGESLEQG